MEPMTYNKSLVTRIYLLVVVAIVIWLLVDRGSEMFDLFSASHPVLIVALVIFSVLPFALVLINGERTSHYAKIFNQCCANHFIDKRL